MEPYCSDDETSVQSYALPMRIVLITPDLTGRSGWSRYALDLGKALHERGHEMHAVVSRTVGNDWCSQSRFLRQPTSYLSNGFLRRWHAWRLARTLRRINPDIVHVIAEPYALMLPLINNPTWKSVLTIHGSYAAVPLLINPQSRASAEQYYHTAHAIISVSAFTKNYLKKKEPELFKKAELEKRINVVHNAIDLSGITLSTKKKNDVLSVMSVSAVKRKKGILQAVEAVALFLQKNPVKLRYDIIGSYESDPSFTKDLREKIQSLKLESVVRLRGSITDNELDIAYNEADLFLLPSLQEGEYFEGFGLVFLEANARGVPVIGANTGGCPEAINDGTTGYVIDPLKTDEIAKRMEDVLIHHRIKREECRAWAESHDSRDTAKTIEGIYSSLR